MYFKDPRDYQILFLSLFLILGIGARDWSLRPQIICVAIITCVATQLLMSFLIGQGSSAASSIKSALITSLGLSLLLRSDHWTTMVLAGMCAIASKFVFRVGDKHFFNPANFGIITALVFTNDAWVSPGQWGEDWWYALCFALCGGLVLKRVGRWDTTATFLGTYCLLEVVRSAWLGWTWDVTFHRLMSGSLLLFALFMVTDPRSIPNASISRIVWSFCIAILTFILRNHFYLSTAVFWALFILAPMTILFDTLWQWQRFEWTKPNETVARFPTS
jgi:Na+-transporting NADH:ubiquinone oxidoreductase subunit NqrB